MERIEKDKMLKRMIVMAIFVSLTAGFSLQKLYGQNGFQPKMEVTGLVSKYPLTRDGNDSMGKNEPMVLARVEFENGAIYSDGRYTTNEGLITESEYLNIYRVLVQRRINNLAKVG